MKVDPKKRILFDPKASVDFQGNTGPFIQYTYARIQAILKKITRRNGGRYCFRVCAYMTKKNPSQTITIFPEVIQQAAANYSPALVANYAYDLVKGIQFFLSKCIYFGC